jgi:uncharacterized protein (DUF1778 family)
MVHATPAVLSVRVSRDERVLLEAAAEHARTNLSDFIRRKAIEAAEADLLERRIVTIPAEDWEKFEAWVDSPAKEVPALRRLSATRPAWQD